MSKTTWLKYCLHSLICWQERHLICIFMLESVLSNSSPDGTLIILGYPLYPTHGLHLSFSFLFLTFTYQMWMSVSQVCVQRSVWTLQGVSVASVMVVRAWSWARTSGAVRWNTWTFANINQQLHSSAFTFVVKSWIMNYILNLLNYFKWDRSHLHTQMVLIK